MVNRVQSLRSSTAGARPTGRSPGEIFTNFPDNALGVVNAAGTAIDLVAVRFFSTLATYVIGDHVIQAGNLYRAIANNGPGAFAGASWSRLATLADLSGVYLPLAGGTLTGLLTGTTINAATALQEGGVALTAKYGQLAVDNNWTGAQTITTPGTGVFLNLVSTDAGAAGSPDFSLTRDSITPAAADSLARIRYRGNNSTPALIDYANITAAIIDPTAGAEAGYFQIAARYNGSIAPRFRVGRGLYSFAAIGGDTGVETINARTLYEDGIPIVTRYSGGYRNIARRNGGFEVWQRGAGGSASFAIAASASTPYTADGWYFFNGANQASVVSQQAGIGSGSQWCAKVLRNNGQTGIGNTTFGFPLDTDEIYPLLGQFVRLSFVAKAGANWSPASGAITAYFLSGTAAPLKSVFGFTGQVVNGVNFNLTTTATRYQFVTTAIVATNTRQAEIRFDWTPVGTAGADDSFYIDDVQLEVVPDAAQVASPFERLLFKEQLRLCQRYFYKTFKYNIAPAQNTGIDAGEVQGIAGKAGASVNNIFLRYPTELAAPSLITTLYNPIAANAEVRDETAGGDCSATAIAGNRVGLRIGTTGNAATAVGNTLGVHVTADAGI